jgi:hypothetical protein
VGQRLDVAEDQLDNAGVTYHTIGGGMFGIVVKSDWGVCSTQDDGGDLGLVVGHFTCGA